ncbi:MAG TPA: hypothetical protein VGI64_16255 [Streptosporangiaceae bacterium]|jgi:hypothetical protein
MRKFHRLAAVAATMAAAGAVVLAGVTAASAAPHGAAKHGAAKHGAAKPAAKAASGTEHFRLIDTSFASSRASFLATGAFTAGGVDHEGKGNTDLIVTPGGTFKLRHSNGTGPTKVNPKTCLLTTSQHGTYRLFGGTGRFKGISGHGTYHVSILAVARRTSAGKCSQKKPPAAAQIIINASGPVRL